MIEMPSLLNSKNIRHINPKITTIVSFGQTPEKAATASSAASGERTKIETNIFIFEDIWGY